MKMSGMCSAFAALPLKRPAKPHRNVSGDKRAGSVRSMISPRYSIKSCRGHLPIAGGKHANPEIQGMGRVSSAIELALLSVGIQGDAPIPCSLKTRPVVAPNHMHVPIVHVE